MADAVHFAQTRLDARDHVWPSGSFPDAGVQRHHRAAPVEGPQVSVVDVGHTIDMVGQVVDDVIQVNACGRPLQKDMCALCGHAPGGAQDDERNEH